MAGFFNKILNSMKLEDDDYDEDDEEFEPDEEFDDLDYTEEPKSVNVSATPLFSKKEKVEVDLDDEEEEEPAPRKNFFKAKKQTQTNVVPMRRSSMEVCMIKPNGIGDTKDIVEVLCSGRAVVINMEGVNLDMAQRIIDFASGAVYAINGKLQSISTNIFIITPKNIDLTGDFAGSIGGGESSVNYNI